MKKAFSATLTAAVFTMSFISVTSTADIDPPDNNGVLLFNSGFEPGSEVFHRADPFTGDDKIRGQDTSVAPPNDWINDIDNSTNVGSFSLQYQGGDTTKRKARIIREPGNPDNHVLSFKINEPWVNPSGSRLARVQANIYDENPNTEMEGIKQLYQKFRLFLHEDMEILKSYPDRIHWLTLFEVWNNRTWGGAPYAYRLAVSINTTSAESEELVFRISGQDHGNGGYSTLWSEFNTDVPVPVGEWMTLEYYMKEGNSETGRFYMTMETDESEKVVLFDMQNYTHNSGHPDPDGIFLWNPLKLYTSWDLASFAKEQGKTLEVYWDDLEIWKDKMPSGMPPNTPYGLTAFPDEDEKNMELKWSYDNITNHQFVLERSEDNGATFAELAVLGSEHTSYTDENISMKEYVYRVKAISDYGISAWSNTASFYLGIGDFQQTSPFSGTSRTIDENESRTLHFRWSAANSGFDIAYTWYLYPSDYDYTDPIATFELEETDLLVSYKQLYDSLKEAGIRPGATFEGKWAVKAQTRSMEKWSSEPFNINLTRDGTETSTVYESDLPREYKLEQNHPNPFNPVTNIQYALPEPGHVTLTVYDLIGRQIQVLVNEVQSSGYKNVRFDATGLSSGIYIYRIESGDFVKNRQMMLVK